MAEDKQDGSGDFWQARKDFLAHLRYTKGYSQGTFYAYNSDLGIWGRWLDEANHDWRHCSTSTWEQWRQSWFASSSHRPQIPRSEL